MVKPAGTGMPMLVISAMLAPLPPKKLLHACRAFGLAVAKEIYVLLAASHFYPSSLAGGESAFFDSKGANPRAQSGSGGRSGRPAAPLPGPVALPDSKSSSPGGQLAGRPQNLPDPIAARTPNSLIFSTDGYPGAIVNRVGPAAGFADSGVQVAAHHFQGFGRQGAHPDRICPRRHGR